VTDLFNDVHEPGLIMKIRFSSVASLLVVSGLAAGHALAQTQAPTQIRIEKFTPTGVDALIEQTTVRFNTNVAALGEKANIPVSVVCNGQKIPLARARWASGEQWEASFAEPIAAGSQCEAVVSLANNPSFKPVTFKFATSQPVVVRAWPNTYDRIDENQTFVLQTNVPSNIAIADAFRAGKPYCSSSKFGERVDLQLVKADEAKAIIDAIKRELPKGLDTTRLAVAKCARPLGEDARVNIVWGKAIEYTTQPAFRASLSCEREQANRPCIPVRPLSLSFSTPVNVKDAKEIFLKSDKGQIVRAVVSARDGEEVTSVQFKPPFDESMQYKVVPGKGLIDLFGRTLTQTTLDSLKFTTGNAPPLAKFSASFGIVERQIGALPVTIRNLGQKDGLSIRSESTLDDATLIQWMRMAEFEGRNEYSTRQIPLLAKNNALKPLALPAVNSTQSMQVMGIPLTQPGLHRVEIESDVLGKTILDPRPDGSDRKMYVRSYALVTGMAVHLKLSSENALVWVTSLETGKVIPEAQINVLNCLGESVWKGVSDKNGIARIAEPFAKVAPAKCEMAGKKIAAMFVEKTKTSAGKSKPSNGDDVADEGGYEQPSAWYVATAKKDNDFSFVSSTWNEGIEPWRFNVSTSYGSRPEEALLGHTIFARNLLRQGEVVHMKHMFRKAIAAGLTRPGADIMKGFTAIEIAHQGSEQTYTVPIKWLSHDAKNGTATSEWSIPAQAKLGMYSVRAIKAKPVNAASDDSAGMDGIDLGAFQVAEFRLPTMRGVIDVKSGNDIAVQMNFINGGAAAGLSTTVSALANRYSPNFSEYPEFNFGAVASRLGVRIDEDSDANTGAANPQAIPAKLQALRTQAESVLLADKKELKLDANGAGKLSLSAKPAVFSEAQSVRVEVNYPDPNGEIQTISNTAIVWPSQLVLGFKGSDWWAGKDRTHQVLALSPAGKPLAGVAVSVEGFLKTNTSVRNRTVGGFYRYENNTEFKTLGEVCSGKTDAKGLLNCNVQKTALNDKIGSSSSNLLLLASAKDTNGQEANAGKQVWSYSSNAEGDDSSWYEQGDSDRIDLIPEKRTVAAGEKARFQLFMPFEKATALVSVEREGIVEAFVMELNRGNPTIEVPMKAEYAPNVMVSVLAIRPRLEPLSWGSFFTWGWKSPLQWWKSRKQSLLPATAMVDLAKPSFRIGLTEVKVPASQALKVTVTPSNVKVEPRQEMFATVQVQGMKAGDKSPSRIAVAVVDEALLELKANDSWDLVAGLWRNRNYGVQTSTAQMLVIGKRHFGLKAQAPGGGGGRGATREMLDTLAYWNPDVVLDAEGKAQIKFKANDSLTRFKVMVFAESGDDLVGTGSTAFDVSKDLQIIAGLPPVVREGDQISASATLRNTTSAAMSVQFKAVAGKLNYEQTVDIAANTSRQVNWPVNYAAEPEGPSILGDLKWRLKANSGNRSDELAVTQVVKPFVANGVVAAQLVRIDGPQSLTVKNPVGGISGRSLVRLEFTEKLGLATAGVKRYFDEYPFYCLEQRTSKAVGMRSAPLWKIISDTLPTYLDKDGLAAYYPSERTQGSDVLTAYVISAAHAGKWSIPEESLERMLNGLSLFAQGKLRRDLYSPSSYQGVDSARLLGAIEALTLHGRATPAMLSVIDASAENMAKWPTSQVIDWVSVVARMKFDAAKSKQKEQWLAQGYGVLRNRMRMVGTEMTFDNEGRDDWWWMMASSDTNAAKLLYAVMDSRESSSALLAEWLQDMPKLMQGLMARQRNGAWGTTTANLWGSFALEKYAQNFERDAVTGVTSAELAGRTASSTWVAPKVVGNPNTAKTLEVRWPSGKEKEKENEKEADKLDVKHTGTGRPYATVLIEAAIPVQSAVDQGYKLSKKLIPVSQSQSGKVTVGDVYRVEVTIDASQSMTWVAVSDTIPAGASILGSLRSSEVELKKSEQAATKPSNDSNRWSYAWLAFEEQRFDSYRAFYEFLPKGVTTLSYTFRVSQAGVLKVPASRIEAMYKPSVYGLLPNADWTVLAK
jgi:alpha-2-macroglobulin